jgi:polyisoprenoid-binding protein YceI
MANTTKWIVDPTHSEVHFKVKHLVIATVTGSFDKFGGYVETTSSNFSDAVAKFTIEVNSINTNQPERDTHLRSPEFFDAAKYPEITFVSKNMQKKEGESYELTGDLTMRGITKEIVLKADFGGMEKDYAGKTKAGFEVEGKLSRKEFGLTWNALTETGNMVVADEVKIIINLELVKD